jgi:hypothetical protein
LRLPAGWQRAGRVLTWTPLVASVFDCLEDVALLMLATAPAAAVPPGIGPPGTGPGLLPLLAGIAATIKYLNLSVLAPAYGIAGSLKGLAHDRRSGALLIYLLVAANAVAFVARPLQQIPACF